MLALAAVAAAAPAAEDHPSRFAAAVETSRAAMERMRADSGVPGFAVAVAVDGELVWNEAFGSADLEQRVAATPATRFGIGSISKAFTTAVFARLAERGKVAWDTPIRQYLPDFPAGDKITARMLAAHLSGLDDRFNLAHRETLEQFSSARLLQEAMREPLRHPPGSQFFYATGTYNILAAILEKVEGRPFQQIVSRELLVPLGMSSTVPNDRRAIIPDRTAMYDEAAGKLRNVYPDSTFKLAGAGYLATASDLARFGAALLHDQVVSARSREELFAPVKTASGEQPVTGTGRLLRMQDVGVGLGWSIATDAAGRRVIHQPGGGVGVSAWLVLYPQQKLVIAIVSNHTGAPVGGQAFRAAAAAFLQALEPGPAPSR